MCIESPSLYKIPTVGIFPKKETNEMVLFKVNLGNEEVKVIKCCTLAYLIHAQYDNFSDVEESSQEREIGNISAETSKTKAEVLPTVPTSSKIIFPGDHTHIRIGLLQDAKISEETPE